MHSTISTGENSGNHHVIVYIRHETISIKETSAIILNLFDQQHLTKSECAYFSFTGRVAILTIDTGLCKTLYVSKEIFEKYKEYSISFEMSKENTKEYLFLHVDMEEYSPRIYQSFCREISSWKIKILEIEAYPLSTRVAVEILADGKQENSSKKYCIIDLMQRIKKPTQANAIESGNFGMLIFQGNCKALYVWEKYSKELNGNAFPTEIIWKISKSCLYELEDITIKSMDNGEYVNFVREQRYLLET